MESSSTQKPFLRDVLKLACQRSKRHTVRDNDPRHPDFFRTPQVARPRPVARDAVAKQAPAAAIVVSGPTPGGTRYERRRLPSGLEIELPITSSVREYLRANGESDKTTAAPPATPSKLPSSAEKRMWPTPGEVSAARRARMRRQKQQQRQQQQQQQQSQQQEQQQLKKKAICQKVLDDSSGKNIGVMDAHELAELREKSQRVADAAKTEQMQVTTPGAVSSMPYGHSSAEKVMWPAWPTVLAKRRRARSPSSSSDDGEDKSDSENHSPRLANLASSRRHRSRSSRARKHADAADDAFEKDGRDQHSKKTGSKSKRKRSKRSAANCDGEKRQRRKRKLENKQPVPVTHQVPKFPIRLDHDKAPIFSASDSNADKLQKLFDRLVAEAQEAVAAVYGPEGTYLGGLTTRVVRERTEQFRTAIHAQCHRVREQEAKNAAALETVLKQQQQQSSSSSSTGSPPSSDAAVVVGELEMYERLERRFLDDAELIKATTAEFLQQVATPPATSDAPDTPAHDGGDNVPAAPAIEIDSDPERCIGAVQQLARDAPAVMNMHPGLQEMLIVSGNAGEFVDEDMQLDVMPRRIAAKVSQLEGFMSDEDEHVPSLSLSQDLAHDRALIEGLEPPATPQRRDRAARFSLASTDSLFFAPTPSPVKPGRVAGSMVKMEPASTSSSHSQPSSASRARAPGRGNTPDSLSQPSVRSASRPRPAAFTPTHRRCSARLGSRSSSVPRGRGPRSCTPHASEARFPAPK